MLPYVAGRAFALMTIGAATALPAQSIADSVLLSVPTTNTLRCVPLPSTADSGPAKSVLAYAFHVGSPAFQMRDRSGTMIASGPSPRIVTVAFDPVGHPVSLSDSVFRAWRNGAVVVLFSSATKPTGWRQFTTIDSAQAMALAMKLGPARLLEASAEAEKLQLTGPRELLDSLGIARARALAAFLWTKTCGPGGKA